MTFEIALTENEKKMIVNIGANDYNDGDGSNEIWAQYLDCGPFGAFVPKSSFGGIVGSLVAKGLAKTFPGSKKSEDTIRLTPNGVRAFAELRATAPKRS